VESNTADGATTHVFTRQVAGPQNPSLTLALSQPNQQDYEYPLAVVSSFELRTPVDDLVNATVSFVAQKEVEHADYTPAFQEDGDVVFRNHDVVIKFADTYDNLNSAEGVCIKEFSLTVANNSRPN